MSTAIQYTIQSLLKEDKLGTISGPMSPLGFANDMAKEIDFKFNRLARVRFNDERLFQKREGDGLTGHDILIIGCQSKDDLWLSLWVDKGVGGLPVAMCYQSDKEVIITPIYEREKFALKLPDESIQKIFTYLFENANVLSIRSYQ